MNGAYELSIDRVIDAPVAAVWQAWTAHQEEWFCPRPWRVEIVAQELHAGGRSAMVMHGPDGEAMPMEGVFLEVVPQRRIVSTDAFAAGWRPQEAYMVRIDTFAPDGDRTAYTATARHWTEQAYEQHKAMGFAAGWGASADQLEEVAKRIARGL